jgi:hypothetical protein
VCALRECCENVPANAVCDASFDCHAAVDVATTKAVYHRHADDERTAAAPLPLADIQCRYPACTSVECCTATPPVAFTCGGSFQAAECRVFKEKVIQPYAFTGFRAQLCPWKSAAATVGSMNADYTCTHTDCCERDYSLDPDTCAAAWTEGRIDCGVYCKRLVLLLLLLLVLLLLLLLLLFFVVFLFWLGLHATML